MKAMKPNTVDAIVCDPPYGLEFMGKEWDKINQHNTPSPNKTYPKNRNLRGIRYAESDGNSMQLWHARWLTEAYRVLKPGGSMLVMGGTRTFHRLACAIEDSGFIIKDTLMWLYGSGFPKAQDLGKMIDKRMGKEREIVDIKKHSNNFDSAKANKIGYLADPANKNNEKCFGYGEEKITTPTTDLAKHWDGFKVGGIKPAYEPIIWAVKPPEGSYVDNVLKWGVGAVNVDECRIGINDDDFELNTRKASKEFIGVKPFGGDNNKKGSALLPNTKGRFPANVILSHHPECVQVGMKRVKGTASIGKPSIGKPAKLNRVGSSMSVHPNPTYYNDPDGLETVESWDCHPDCAVRLLDEQSGVLKSGGGNKRNTKPNTFRAVIRHRDDSNILGNNNGGASRFFYCAKASRGERNAGLEGNGKPITKHNARPCDWEKADWSKRNTNNHPTVKPIKLFEYLIKLVTRQGQIVLDPFIGSGTTAIAAHNTGRKCVGIEKEDEYLTIATRRIDHWKNQPKQMTLGG